MNRHLQAACLALGAWAMPAAAAAEPVLLETYSRWQAYAQGDGEARECWASTKPVRWDASRKGVNRGDIYLMVALRPARGVVNEVVYQAGYPLNEGQPVTVEVAGQKSALPIKEGENAWPKTPLDDAILVEAFRKGNQAVVQAMSTRGTSTTDTFSLIGFTKALERAADACGG